MNPSSVALSSFFYRYKKLGFFGKHIFLLEKEKFKGANLIEIFQGYRGK
jgi:hypothetical protein